MNLDVCGINILSSPSWSLFCFCRSFFRLVRVSKLLETFQSYAEEFEDLNRECPRLLRLFGAFCSPKSVILCLVAGLCVPSLPPRPRKVDTDLKGNISFTRFSDQGHSMRNWVLSYSWTYRETNVYNGDNELGNCSQIALYWFIFHNVFCEYEALWVIIFHYPFQNETECFLFGVNGHLFRQGSRYYIRSQQINGRATWRASRQCRTNAESSHLDWHANNIIRSKSLC